jgi:hypothetical protein
MKSKELSLDKREVIANIKADGYKISYFSGCCQYMRVPADLFSKTRDD